LDVGPEQTLPQIVEVTKHEEDLEEAIVAKSFPPMTEDEKMKIEVTRSRLTAWFPI
jgi:hypothetical protein